MANRYTKFGGGGGGVPIVGCDLVIPVNSYKLRFGCMGVCGAGWSVNYDPVSGLPDDPALASYLEQFDPTVASCNGLIKMPNGDVNVWNRGATLYSTTQQTIITGDVSEELFLAATLREGAIGGTSEGSIITRVRGFVTTGIAGGLVVTAYIGADVIPLLTVPASQSVAFEADLHIGYDKAANTIRYATRGCYAGAPVQMTAIDGTIDPSHHQSIQVTVQLSDLADRVDCNSGEVIQQNTDFCPVPS
jgi:hypothetical protein